MGWILVFFAALFEFVGVIGLKKFSEKRNVLHALLYVGGFASSFGFLYFSFQFLQVSTAYAVWVGIGTAGAVLINMIFFGESRSAGRIVSVALIVIGVVGLKALS
ncbi:MAG TPA: multidrug efflux SMR transporter [Pseudogracilibacillus sp.]|nr:multidrug efflux SMR transporter [Pseudogracilibacillus sp.]